MSQNYVTEKSKGLMGSVGTRTDHKVCTIKARIQLHETACACPLTDALWHRSLHGLIEINVSVSRSVSFIWLDRKSCITYIYFFDFYRSDGKSSIKRESEKVHETPFTLSAPEVAPTITAWSPVQDHQLRAQLGMTGQRLPTRLMPPYAFITR